MAFTERVSKLHYIPQDFNEQIDIRRTRLPSRRMTTLGYIHYEPLDHREPQNPIKPWMAYLNLLRTLFGPGMLIMPLAISQAGYFLGPLLTFFTGCILIYTHLMLLRCLNDVSKQLRIPYISYRYGFRIALLHGPPFLHGIGKRGPAIIAVIMFLSQLGICTVFIIMTADCLRDLLDWTTTSQALLAMIVPYLIMEMCMKSLRVVSYFSFAANILNLVGLILIFVQMFAMNNKDVQIVAATSDFLPLLFAFGTFLFNLSAVGVILSCDKALKEARLMSSKFGVVRVGLMAPTLVSMIFGGLGYWAFGTMEENILRALPLVETTSVVILSIYVVSVALSYPLQCQPAIATILEVIKYHDPLSVPEDKTLKLVEVIGRPVFVLLTFLISHLVPYQGPFVAFVGSLCTSMLSLVFPALMSLCLRYPEYNAPYDMIVFKDVMLILLGIIVWLFGAIFCGYVIYVRILSNQSPNNMGYF